jgi:hypothetical protein
VEGHTILICSVESGDILSEVDLGWTIPFYKGYILARGNRTELLIIILVILQQECHFNKI